MVRGRTGERRDRRLVVVDGGGEVLGSILGVCIGIDWEGAVLFFVEPSSQGHTVVRIRLVARSRKMKNALPDLGSRMAPP
jgi:hypothetical protein